MVYFIGITVERNEEVLGHSQDRTPKRAYEETNATMTFNK